jgi:hypothetical protein
MMASVSSSGISNDRNPSEDGNASSQTDSYPSIPQEGVAPSTEFILSSDGELSVDEVSRLMREQDADLLESMHYASSQVSQYSPGGTPMLRPADRSLPHDELPMLEPPALSPAPRELIMCSRPSVSTMSRNVSISSSASMSLSADFRGSNNNNKSSPLHQGDISAGSPSLQALSLLNRVVAKDPIDTMSLFRESSASNVQQAEQELKLTPSAEALNESIIPKTKGEFFRRCLSGDVYAVEREEDHEGEHADEETTASPVSVAQEAAEAITTTTDTPTTDLEEESGKAQQRRLSEALQFAEAVGERIPVSQDKLRIIEDGTDDDDSDDDQENPRGHSSPSSNKEVKETSALHHQPRHLHLLDSFAVLPEDEPINHVVLPKVVDVHEPPVKDKVAKRKSRPTWPFGPAGTESLFLDRLNNDSLDHKVFEYKGICANPPEITKRGTTRGNYALLHRKAWLEVSDKYHRYGKNLRSYYRYWEKLGFPTNQFFEWLDSKGEAAGQPLPNLDECPRSVLDADTVLYISNPEITEKYAINIVCSDEGKGRLVDVDGDPVLTGPDGWIFVLRDNVMYGAKKVTSLSGHSKQRFHHSSFFGGKAVASAGIVITDDDGYLARLYPHSGHYRPTESHMQRMLFFLHRKGVALRSFEMDTQQFRHVARDNDLKVKEKEKDKEKRPYFPCESDAAATTAKDSGSEKGDKEKKAKKVDNLHLEKAVHVACFLAHKASFVGEGIFDCIHKIRKADVASVSEALDTVDDGGYWPKNFVKVADTGSHSKRNVGDATNSD